MSAAILTDAARDDGTDFNDMAALYGPESVADLVANAERDNEPHYGAYFDDAGPQEAEAPPAWPDPVLPGAVRVPDFPSNLLQGVWGEMAAAVAANTQTPPAMATMCVLGVLATLLQRRYEVAPYGSDYTEPLSLWVVSVSPPGTRKTAVMNSFLRPFVKWEKMQRDRYRVLIARNNAARSTSKKRIESLNAQAAKCKDAAELTALRTSIENEELDMPDEVLSPRLFTGDTTAERLQAMLVENSERMAVHSDEPGIFRVMAGAYSGGSQNLDVFLQGHAGSPIRIDRAGRLAHIDKPALSFNLMIQPDLIQELTGSKGFRGSGLLARFLYAIPASNVGKRDVRQHFVISDDLRDRYERSVLSLLDGYLCEPGTVPKVEVLSLCDSAAELWLNFSQEIEDNQGEGGKYESIRDWTAKLAGAVARIAALIELAEFGLSAESVSFDAMDRAIRLGRILIPHAQAAFGLLGVDLVDADAASLLKWARNRESDNFTQREAMKALHSRFSSADKLKKATDRLEFMDCLRQSTTTNKGARSSLCFRLNPAIWPI